MIVYAVRMEAPTRELADEILEWLAHDHVGDVVRAGASDGEVIRIDELTIETRYRFASREAFEAYEAGPAVALRAEGRARFGPERGVRMTRTLGELILRRP